MELETPCELCGERPATTRCGVCGSAVCSEHDRDYGCDVCEGGEQSF